MTPSSNKNPKDILAYWLATGLGSGLMRPAPGTWGSLAALPFGLILFGSGGWSILTLAIILIIPIGIWSANIFDRLNASHGNKMIVIDEFAGQWIALLPALTFYGLNPLATLAAFLLFRVFDILKPWPISVLDRTIKGGLGVMLDDLVAGALAALCIIGGYYAGLS